MKQFLFALGLVLALSNSVIFAEGSGTNNASVPPTTVNPAPAAASSTNFPNPYGVAQMFPSADPIPGGARLTAKFHMKDLGSEVSLSLVGIVTDKNGNKQLIELKRIDDSFQHSTTDYQTERKLDLNYDAMNAELEKKAPGANLKIGPGTELFLYARWMNVPGDMYSQNLTSGANGKWNHQWGGVDRQGKIVLPAPSGATSTAITNTDSGFTKGGFATSLDVGNTIDARLAAKYPGLKQGESIGSRFENELKLHVDLQDLPRVEQYLKGLAADPSKVEAVFGKGWTMHENNKYVGQPMVDVYLDNEHFDASKLGMALRFRTGSGITSLNYKPDDGKYLGKAITARIEYQVNGVTKVDDFKIFMDSDDPMNPLQLIREKLKGRIPSDFTIQAVNITDERLKFELNAPSGDQVEFSLDHVKARKIDKNGAMTGPTAEFGQLEVEVNHLGARGSNNIAGNGTNRANSMGYTLHGQALDAFFATLTPGANLNGRVPPQFHGELDFGPNSPIKTINANNFKLAYDVFDKVLDNVFGQNWNSSGQKYAVSAAALDLIHPDDYAPSVKQMLREKLKKQNPTASEMKSCLQSLVKISSN